MAKKFHWQYFNPNFEYEKHFPDYEWPWAGHKYFAYDLVRFFQPKKIVELGSHRGTSLFSFAQAIKDANLPTQLIGIDTWQGDKHAGYYGEEIWDDVNLIKNRFYSTIDLWLLRKTFQKAVKDIPDDSVDLLHIDGLHTFKAVSNDFKTWLPKVKKNGVILIHDVVERTADFGVYKLWEKIEKKYPCFAFTHSHGLGVVVRDKALFEEMNAFTAVWQKYYVQRWENEKIAMKLEEVAVRLPKLLKEREAFLQTFREIEDSKFYKISRMYKSFRNGIKELFQPH